MSRVTQTELFEGDIATAADFNATLASWNAATAAGQINGANFREEGLDRRSFLRGAVSTDIATPIVRFSTTAIPVGAAFTVLPSEIGPFPAGSVLLHYSLMMRNSALAGAVGSVRLASRAVSGGATTTVALTTRSAAMRIGVNAPLAQTRMERSVTVSVLVTVTAGVNQYFVVEAQNPTAGTMLVQGCVFGQVIAK
jgi:hypothetical protein